MSNKNPLFTYYRQPSTYVQLPSSKGNYISDDVVKYTNDRKEVGVMAMTAHDEVLLKNPNALINGEAVINLIKSCVPTIENPKHLLQIDIELLLASIYSVSQNGIYEIHTTCPNCAEALVLEMNIDQWIDSAIPLEESYPVPLSSGLTAFIRPHTFDSTLKQLAIQFQNAEFLKLIADETKVIEELQNTTKLKQISEAVQKIAEFNFDMVFDCVISIIKESKKPEDSFVVTDKSYIKEFLNNISKKDANKIKQMVEKANSCGLKKQQEASCKSCEHKWEQEVNIDVTNFFTDT